MPALLASPIPAFEAAVRSHDADPASRRAEHLAEYSFRFDAAAAPSPFPVPRPTTGRLWSLAQTLQEIRLRRVALQVTTTRLRVRHAHLLADLAEAVRRHEDAVRLWIDLGRPQPAHAWDDETTLHLRWLTARFAHGRAPVMLRPGVSVTDWPRFLASVTDRVEAGPDAPCAASLRRDLSDLFDRHAILGARPHVERRSARAA